MALPANAGIAAGLVPYKATLWMAFYALVALFVIVAIWEVAMVIMLKRAEQQEFENAKNGSPLSSDDSKEKGSGLMGDSADPFQALLNQATTEPEAPKAEEEPALPKRPGMAGNFTGSAEKKEKTAPFTPFNGAATLPVGGNAPLKARPVASDDDDANPFKRLAKIGSEEAASETTGAANATAPVKSLNMPNHNAAKPATPPTFDGAATLAVQPGSTHSIPMGSSKISNGTSAAPAPATKPLGMGGSAAKPAAVGGASVRPGVSLGNSPIKPSSTIGAVLKPSSMSSPLSKPVGMSSATPKPAGVGATASAGASKAPGVAVKPSSVAGASGADDPWKKLLGQSGVRPATSATPKPADSSTPTSTAPQRSISLNNADPKATGGIKMGGMGTQRPATPSGSPSMAPSRSAATGGADDPWKALLGNSGKGGASSASPASAAQPNGISLGIKKPDSPSMVQGE